MATQVNNMFAGTITPRDITKYTLFRGVTDFSNLIQFNNFESGYPFLILLSIPKFLEQLRTQSAEYMHLIDNYRHILEYEFKGISGFEDITSETQEINNGVSNLQLITKVNMQSASQFSMRYTEKSGIVLAKVHELYLRGIKDPKTQVKTYNGLIADGLLEPGYENEVFEFLYFMTDNTVRGVEKAYLIVAAQPTTATLAEVSNGERGEIQWKEVDLQFNGIPLVGPGITAKAREFLDWVNKNTVFEEAKFGYKALSEMPKPGNTGGIDAASPRITY
jgi:hypothetical protein|nr:MAG TPA: structural protein [Caudoviricetes sp.]DAN20281.1 MAG TPA: virion structural protein [Caudoviricetes sp.]